MKFSGETWVGNLYQKFEAVCHEVDGLVSQEHIKNLESHVQSVGDNVMKLCSNVKDLLPSSLGVPVEVKAKSVNGDVGCVANASQILSEMDVTDSSTSNETHNQVSDEDLLETREEPSSCSSELPFGQSESSVIREGHDEEKQSSKVSERNSDSFTKEKQSPSCGSEKRSSTSNETHNQVSDEDLLETREEPSSSSSELPFGQSESSLISKDHDEEKQSSKVSEQNSDSFTKEKQSPSCGSEATHSGGTLVSSNSGLVTKEEEESPSNFQKSISPDKHLCERAITLFCDQNHDLVDQVPSSVNPALLELSHHCEADFFLIKSRRSNWSVVEIGTPWKEEAEDEYYGSFASTEFSNDGGFKPKQMECSVRFEGSCCVFVESDSIQGDSGRATSRKKRVMGSFSWRKKVVEKEYKQLGIWYGDVDAELDECSQHKLISNNKHLSSSSQVESEWELL